PGRRDAMSRPCDRSRKQHKRGGRNNLEGRSSRPYHVVVRRCPTLPHPGGCSTIGAGRLSFRVRNGTGRFPAAMTTETPAKQPHRVWCFRVVEWMRSVFVGKSSAD